MIRSLIILAMAIAFAVFTAIPAAAAPGDNFGQHVASMVPQHAIAHGALFGDCISDMATTGTCSHHEGLEE